jgi:hypothetical protein
MMPMFAFTNESTRRQNPEHHHHHPHHRENLKSHIISKTIDAVLCANKEDGLEVNTEKAEYMFMSHYQNVGQNLNINIADKSIKTVAKFKYLEQKHP